MKSLTRKIIQEYFTVLKTDPPDVFLHQADLFLSYLYMAHVQYHIAGKSYFRLSFLPLLNTSFF